MMTLLGSEAADSFLKAFWASRHGALEGPKLFSKFKEEYKTPEKAHEISLDLRRAAEIGLRPAHGTTVDTTSRNVVAIQFSGVGGNFKIYR